MAVDRERGRTRTADAVGVTGRRADREDDLRGFVNEGGHGRVAPVFAAAQDESCSERKGGQRQTLGDARRLVCFNCGYFSFIYVNRDYLSCDYFICDYFSSDYFNCDCFDCDFGDHGREQRRVEVAG